MKAFGTVKDAVTEMPLPGAKIILYIRKKELAVLYTDNKGEFEHKEADQYIGENLTCKVEKDGYKPEQVMQQFEEDEVNLAIKLVPEKEEKIELKLNLKDKKRNPLKNVKVTLEVNGEQVGVSFSDKNGICKITLSPYLKDKTLNYKAELGGFEVAEGKITLEKETPVITMKSTVPKNWLMTTAGKIAVGAVATIVVILAAIIIPQLVSLEPPNIQYFEAEPSVIEKGGYSTLVWETSNAEEVEIAGIGEVSLYGERNVRPEVTTTYTLIAKNEEGKSVERDVTVEVIVPNVHSISNIELDPPSSRTLLLTSQVNVAFHYATTEPGGVRIFVRPFTGGSLTPNYAASESPLYPTGKGKGEGYFTIQSEEVTVDQLRFQMNSFQNPP